jgi:hypothetical protein
MSNYLLETAARRQLKRPAEVALTEEKKKKSVGATSVGATSAGAANVGEAIVASATSTVAAAVPPPPLERPRKKPRPEEPIVLTKAQINSIEEHKVHAEAEARMMQIPFQPSEEKHQKPDLLSRVLAKSSVRNCAELYAFAKLCIDIAFPEMTHDIKQMRTAAEDRTCAECGTYQQFHILMAVARIRVFRERVAEFCDPSNYTPFADKLANEFMGLIKGKEEGTDRVKSAPAPYPTLFKFINAMADEYVISASQRIEPSTLDVKS